MIEAPEALCLVGTLNGVIKGKVVTWMLYLATPRIKFNLFQRGSGKIPGDVTR